MAQPSNRTYRSSTFKTVRAASALRGHGPENGLYLGQPIPEVRMRYATQVKSISHLKAKAAEVLRDLSERREPLVITQHGEAKAVLQDVASWDATQETLALLKLLALGQREVEAGEVSPIAQAVERIRARDP